VIVDEPPFDLVALFADADAQKLFEAAIERGQERRCLSSFRWRSIRDARRDALAHQPERVLGPLLESSRRFLVTWDHEGSGFETEKPEAVENRVVEALTCRGIPRESVLAVAHVPEVEQVLVPVFRQCLALLADKRRTVPPPDDLILSRAGKPGRSLEKAFAERPKELLNAAILLLNLRPSASLFQDLGRRLSLPDLKQGACTQRIASALHEWFPGNGWC
jgi:AcrR family transcriptional regulator